MPNNSKKIENIGKNDSPITGDSNYSDNNSDTIKSKQMDLDAGVLGKFFGSASSAPTNIAGITMITLLIISLSGTFFPNEDIKAGDLWKITTPIMTLILGYLFGKQEK